MSNSSSSTTSSRSVTSCDSPALVSQPRKPKQQQEHRQEHKVAPDELKDSYQVLPAITPSVNAEEFERYRLSIQSISLAECARVALLQELRCGARLISVDESSSGSPSGESTTPKTYLWMSFINNSDTKTYDVLGYFSTKEEALKYALCEAMVRQKQNQLLRPPSSTTSRLQTTTPSAAGLRHNPPPSTTTIDSALSYPQRYFLKQQQLQRQALSLSFGASVTTPDLIRSNNNNSQPSRSAVATNASAATAAVGTTNSSGANTLSTYVEPMYVTLHPATVLSLNNDWTTSILQQRQQRQQSSNQTQQHRRQLQNQISSLSNSPLITAAAAAPATAERTTTSATSAPTKSLNHVGRFSKQLLPHFTVAHLRRLSVKSGRRRRDTEHHRSKPLIELVSKSDEQVIVCFRGISDTYKALCVDKHIVQQAIIPQQKPSSSPSQYSSQILWQQQYNVFANFYLRYSSSATPTAYEYGAHHIDCMPLTTNETSEARLLRFRETFLSEQTQLCNTPRKNDYDNNNNNKGNTTNSLSRTSSLSYNKSSQTLDSFCCDGQSSSKSSGTKSKRKRQTEEQQVRVKQQQQHGELTLHGVNIGQPPPPPIILPTSSVVKTTTGTITAKLLDADFLSKLPLQQHKQDPMKQKVKSKSFPQQQQLQQILQEQNDSTMNEPGKERHSTDPKTMQEPKAVQKGKEVWAELQQPWPVSNQLQPKIEANWSQPIFLDHHPTTDTCTGKASLSTAHRYPPSVLLPLGTRKTQQEVKLMREEEEWQPNVSLATPSHGKDTRRTYFSDTTRTNKRKLDFIAHRQLAIPSSNATFTEDGATAASTTTTETSRKRDGATSSTTPPTNRINIDIKKYRPTVVSTHSIIDVTCVLCQESKAQVIFLPCKHCILCSSCCKRFDYCSPPLSYGRSTNHKFCLTCRVPIQSTVQPQKAVFVRPRICSAALFF